MADNIHLTEDEKVLHNMGYAQELTRRMGAFQNFAISFAIICIVAGGITAFPVALSAGGGISVGIVWVLGSIFALLVAAAMGQVASSYPTAGGIYHWASILGGRGFGWAAAWFNLLGLMFVVSSVNAGLFFLFRDLFLAQVVGMDVTNWVSAGEFSTGWWYQTIFIAAATILQAIINHRYLDLTTKLTDWSGYIILATAVVFTLALLAYAPSLDFGRLFRFTNFTGDAGGGVWPASTSFLYIFLIGLLHVVYTITGFDASAHTSEETRNAQAEVPKGMLRSVFWSFVFGYAMVAAMVLALPDQKDEAGAVIDGVTAGAKQGWGVYAWLIAQVPFPGFLRTLIILGIVVSNFLCALAGLTSASRMMYAFARDGGLPASDTLMQVNPATRTPGAAVWVAGVLAFIATLYGGAFVVLSTGCAVFLYLSYLMPIGAALKSEMDGKWTNKGPFNLGGASILVAALALIGCAILIYVGVQAPNQKVGYLIVLMVLALIGFWQAMEGRLPLGLLFSALTGLAVWYFWHDAESSFGGWAGIITAAVMGVLSMMLNGKRFMGPPIGDEIKRRQAEIAAREAAMTGRPVTLASSGGGMSAASGTSISSAAPVAAAAAAATNIRSSMQASASQMSPEEAKANAERSAAARAAAERVAAERLAAARKKAEEMSKERSATMARAASDDSEKVPAEKSASRSRSATTRKAPAKSAAPKRAAKPRAPAVDDITLVDGIGPKLKKELASVGINSLSDLSKLSSAEIKALDAKIPRDAEQIADWVSQAKDLLAGKAPRAASDRARKAAKK